MTMNEVATDIRKIYQAQSEPNELMSIVRMAGYTDYTPEQIAPAMIEMARAGEILLFPESCQAALTEMNRRYAVTVAGDANHLFMIES